MSFMYDVIKDSLWKNKRLALLYFISPFPASVCQIWTFAVFPAPLYLRKKDPGGKVLVVQEGNRSNIFHQVSILCLQIHKTCGGQLGEAAFMDFRPVCVEWRQISSGMAGENTLNTHVFFLQKNGTKQIISVR